MSFREDARRRIVEAAERCEDALLAERSAFEAGDLLQAATCADLAAMDSAIAFLNARMAVSS